ncbi:MAG TPA: NAD(P)-dependent oxidoreductase [Chthoniobacterales bacterium]|nr:NAD(P)-dependent oxidoreductase [Chthoniobacterales bacterium]
MANLGFLGLGIMGGPMAGHLLKAGHRVALWSHSPGKAQELAKTGNGQACSTPADVAAVSDYIFLCVGDSDMSRETILGEQGIIKGAKPGTVVVDTSTVSPSVSRQIGAELSKNGIAFLDAPCTGSKAGATNGTLTFMVGGDQDVFQRTKPYLEHMGKNFYYCGGPGMGLQAKLTQNLILSNILQAFNEGMVLAVKGGMDPELMFQVLDNSAAKSGLIAYKTPFVLDRNFETNFSIKWMHKDIGLMLESGKELGVPLPLTGLTQQMFRAAMAKGFGDEDICSTIKVLEEFAGVEVKRTSQKV